MNDFYLTLPSDSSMGMFPDNTLSTYRTYLNPPIQLNHQEWEVGVAALAFPTDWYNLTDKENKMRLKIFPWKIIPGMETIKCVSDQWLQPPDCDTVPNNDEGSTEVETHMETNTYRNVEQLLNVLNVTMHGLWKCNEIQDVIYRKPTRQDPNNKQMTPFEKSEQMEYDNRLKLANKAKVRPYASFKLDPLSKRIYLSFDTKEAVDFMRMLPVISFEIEGPMVGMLGWSGLKQKFRFDQLCRRKDDEDRITAPFQPSVDMSFDMFYLYSDIVEPQRVGDIVAPVLDVFHSQSGYFRPSTIHYVPLKYDRLTAIGVYIRTGQGRPVPFVRGKVVAKLHFRKKP